MGSSRQWLQDVAVGCPSRVKLAFAAGYGKSRETSTIGGRGDWDVDDDVEVCAWISLKRRLKKSERRSISCPSRWHFIWALPSMTKAYLPAVEWSSFRR